MVHAPKQVPASAHEHATLRRILFIVLILLLVLLFLVVPSVSWSAPQSPRADSPARALAEKLILRAGPRPALSLVVQNLSSLSEAEVAAVRRLFEQELISRGARLEPPPGALPVVLSLTESSSGMLWVLEWEKDGEQQVAIQPAAPLPGLFTPAPASITLSSRLLLERPEPILNLQSLEAPPGSNRRWLLIEPARILLLEEESGRWRELSSLPLPALPAASRDLRAELLRDDSASFWLSMPGLRCRVVVVPALARECSSEDAAGALPLSAAALVPARNYHVRRAPSVAGSVSREEFFFSEAEIRSGEERWLLRSLPDGRILLYGSSHRAADPLPANLRLGSVFLALETECGHRLLGTGAGDWNEPDFVQTFELQASQLRAAGPAISFPGPVLELFAGDAGHPAVAIVRHLKSGLYEAHAIIPACRR